MAGDPWAVGVRAWSLLQALLFLITRATVPAVRTGQVLAVDRAEAGPVLWWLHSYMWGHHLQTYLNVTFCVLFRPRPRIYTEPLPVGTAPLAMGGRRGAAPHETPDIRRFLGGEFSVAEAMSSVQLRRNGF